MLPAIQRISAPVVSLTSARIALLGFFFMYCLNTVQAQDSALSVSKPYIPYTYQYPYNKKRVQWMTVANVGGYSAALVGLYYAWYKDYPQSSFHTFNDAAEWMQMDKLGHMYSAYAESKASMEMWRWTGMDRKKMIWIGGMSGAAYQTVIEVLDGFSSQWGWSWSDIGANFLGSGMLVAQELHWNEQRIQMKWSFHRKKYDDVMLEKRSDAIFGNGTAERFLKDYNGQTYWLSTSIQSWFPNTTIPSWLQMAVGTGIEGVFGARENKSADDTGASFNRTDITRVRQWYLAPDIDLTKIKTRKRGVRMALNMLNVIKFPAPAMEYAGGKIKFHWLYF